LSTAVLITVDTELSAALFQQGADAARNVAASITGRTAEGEFGVGWQMDVLDRFGLTGVYFVDPMPGLVYGEAVVAAMVEPILRRGHEVQLHIHTEWLEWANDAPVATRGHNIGDFSFDDQLTLLAFARDLLVRAGAPAPVAFRAGNYGADDNTLRALASLGIGWDSSFNTAYAGGDCRIALPQDSIDPLPLHGLIEIPVAGIEDRPGHMRPAQVCALSATEMRDGLLHAEASGRPAFAIVCHSFEMLSRDRQRPNRSVMARFEAMCQTIAEQPGLRSAGFAGLELSSPASPPSRAPADAVRTASRMVGQLIANLRTERQLRPA
jgi:hypothetical protein